MPDFLSPYRGERYHLHDYRDRGRQPTNKEELFNYCHSSLQNVIERCFGVLKTHFPILKLMPPYPITTEKYLLTTCYTIHNFIRSYSPQDQLLIDFERMEDVDDGRGGARCSSQAPIEIDITSSQLREIAQVRDGIADQLWASTHQ